VRSVPVSSVAHKAPIPNRRLRFPLGGSGCFAYPLYAPSASPAAVGETQRWMTTGPL
jgi:hypothetical protein